MGHATTDAELIAASRRGERDAFGHLVERYLGLVCAVSYCTTRDQALSEDVAQETFLAAWAQLDQLRETSRLRSWLCGIARNLARKARARGAREAPHEHVEDAPAALPAAAPATPFEAVSDAEHARVVWGALDRVPAAYREVLVLYYQQQRSIAEVAHALGLSEDAALQRLTRGRRLLAGEVTGLIEATLERARPRRGLAAAVIAALPPLGAAPLGAASASASSSASVPHVVTTHAGGSMFELSLFSKAALAAAALAGLAGVTYVAAVDRAPRPAAAATRPVTLAALAPAEEPVAFPSTAPARPVRRAPAAAAAPAVPADHAAHPGCGECPMRGGVDATAGDGEVLDREVIERTGLYRGPARGPADAPVQIVVFMDLECRFCAAVLGTIDELWDEYPGQLRLVVKQFPLDVHRGAQLAAEASLEAEAQGKYWAFHDLAVAFPEQHSREGLVDLAGRAGLDVAAFTRALDAHTHAGAVAGDVATAGELSVKGTPTFFINGRRFTGAQPIAAFRTAIDQALTR